MIILQIAKNNLLASRRRSLFLGTALFGVTLLFVLLLSLTAGVTDNLIKGATAVSSGHVNIAGYYKSSPTDSQALITNVETLKKEAREAVPDAVVIIDRLRGWGKIIADRGSVQTGINGIDFDEEDDLFSMLTLAPAKDYRENPADPEEARGNFKDLKKPNSILLFAGQAKLLKVEVGDSVTIRTETLKGATNTADVTVVAIARDLGLLSGFAAFVPKQTVIDLYQFKPGVSGVVQIYLKDIERSTAAMNEVRAHLAKKGYVQLEHDAQPFYIKLLQTVPGEDWTGAKLDVTTWEDESSFLVQIIVGLQAVSFALVMLLAFVIVVGISNTMTIAVRERTKEIGTLRAIGMSRGSILGLFLLEAGILGIVAAGAGGLAGAGIAALINGAAIRVEADAMRIVLLSDTLHLVPRVVDVVVAVGVLTLVSTAAAFFPALRAARITPVTAMQSAE
ncbi:MAG: FtsX-like permease family protein [Deltaproteobacteria bacterium]|nr:FtsX-like permease family protein [Deltaproteobacteria bacterium]